MPLVDALQQPGPSDFDTGVPWDRQGKKLKVCVRQAPIGVLLHGWQRRDDPETRGKSIALAPWWLGFQRTQMYEKPYDLVDRVRWKLTHQLQQICGGMSALSRQNQLPTRQAAKTDA